MKPRKLIGALSSKEMLLWLAGGWIIAYVSVAVTIGEAFGRIVNAMSTSMAARVPFALFVVCLLLHTVRIFGRRWKAGRMVALTAVILPLGLVIFLSGFFTSAVYRQTMWIQVGQGQMVSPPWDNRTVHVGEISPALEHKTLQSEDSGLIFAFEPKVKLSDDSAQYTVGAFPPTRIGNSYYHILNFGLAPGVKLQRGDKTVEQGYVMLQLLPPGAEDGFELKPLPYFFNLRIAPEKIVEKGDARMKLYDLDHLAYEVRIRRGDDVVFEGSSADGPVSFEGMDMSFSEPTYWVLLDVVKDPGRTVLIWGLAIIGVGLPFWLLSLLLRRRREG